MSGLNEAVFRAINRWPEGLTPVMRFFSEATNWTWVRLALGTLVLALILANGRGRAAAIQALLAFPLANLITDLFKKGLPMPRPCNALPDVLGHGIGCSESMGTASAHSANMAAVAFVFVYHLRGWGSPWVVVALLTGLSRVFHGAHYPYQVLLGWTCGIFAGFAVTQVARLIGKQRGDVVTDTSANEVQQP